MSRTSLSSSCAGAPSSPSSATRRRRECARRRETQRSNGFYDHQERRRRRSEHVARTIPTGSEIPPALPTMIAESILGVGPAQAASVQDATAEHLIEAFEELPKQDQILMVKKLLNGALREDEVMTKVEEAMVLERAPDVRIAKNETKKDFDAPSTSATTMNEKEILERAVQEMPNASPEQRAKAAEILRRLEEETEKARREEDGGVSKKNTSYDYNSNSSKVGLENNIINDFENEDDKTKETNPFGDEDIVWDLRSAVASLMTVAKAQLVPPLAFGTGFAALALALTKMVGEDDNGNEEDEVRMNEEKARIPSPSTMMNVRNDNTGDIASPLLPMEEAKRLLFESQAIKPPPMMSSTTKKNKSDITRRQSIANNTTSSGNNNGVLWKRKDEDEDLEESVEVDDDYNNDTEEPFEEEEEEEAEEEEEEEDALVLAAAEDNAEEENEVEGEDEDKDEREMSLPQPQKATKTKKKQRRPPPDLSSSTFLSEEDREKNFDNIRARRPR